MEIAVAAEVEPQQTEFAIRPGMTPRAVQWLLSGGAPDGLAFKLYRTRFEEGSRTTDTPRHHHGFQQIRWAESGSINYGPGHTIREGDIAYFPRGTYYGPQYRDPSVGVFLQFGFGPEMPGGKDAERVSRENTERLLARGCRIESGVFIDTDPSTGRERRRDAYEVLAEEYTGSKYTIPPECYAAPIQMHPEAFAYFGVGDGVEIKHLGAFYDHPGTNADVRISMIRLSQGGVHRLGANRTQLVWTKSPGLRIEETTYPELTCVHSPGGEEAVLACVDPVEAFVVEFPRLD
ncbi:hypothetical protein ABIC02_007744 [Bradyrhizobium sp. RT5a]